MNGIRLFRERAGLSVSELARRVGTSRQQMGRLENSERKLSKEWAIKIAPALGCTPHELMWPESARIDVDSFHNVFAILDQDESLAEPKLALQTDLLADLLPGAKRHRLRVMTVEDNTLRPRAERGDALIVDLDEPRVSKPGIYLVQINGTMVPRFLAPTTTGTITVKAGVEGVADESVPADSLSIIGRARLKISRL